MTKIKRSKKKHKYNKTSLLRLDFSYYKCPCEMCNNKTPYITEKEIETLTEKIFEVAEDMGILAGGSILRLRDRDYEQSWKEE